MIKYTDNNTVVGHDDFVAWSNNPVTKVLMANLDSGSKSIMNTWSKRGFVGAEANAEALGAMRQIKNIMSAMDKGSFLPNMVGKSVNGNR